MEQHKLICWLISFSSSCVFFVSDICCYLKHMFLNCSKIINSHKSLNVEISSVPSQHLKLLIKSQANSTYVYPFLLSLFISFLLCSERLPVCIRNDLMSFKHSCLYFGVIRAIIKVQRPPLPYHWGHTEATLCIQPVSCFRNTLKLKKKKKESVSFSFNWGTKHYCPKDAQWTILPLNQHPVFPSTNKKCPPLFFSVCWQIIPTSICFLTSSSCLYFFSNSNWIKRSSSCCSKVSPENWSEALPLELDETQKKTLLGQPW